MPEPGWESLLAGGPTYRGAGAYPIAAYSEFMPPPRVGRTPYGPVVPGPFVAADPRGWHVTEHEEMFELRPGLEQVAVQVVKSLAPLGRGERSHGIARAKLADNPGWPPRLAERAGRLGHERYVVLLPMALSRTQDDKGRVRWAFFGGGEQGPGRAFWQGFLPDPGRPAEHALQHRRPGLLRRGHPGRPAHGG
jgi:hypothetical protein